jgi:hypothetical protein
MHGLYKACLGPLYFAQTNSMPTLIFASCKAFIKVLFFRYRVPADIKSNLIFIHNSNNRPDLLEDFYSFYNHFSSNNESVDILNLDLRGRVNLNFLSSFKFIKDFKEEFLLLLMKSSKRLNFSQKLYLKIRLMHAFILYYNLESQFEKHKGKIFILHKEMEFLQNIFALVCKKSEIRCIALQHGFYEDSGKFVNVENVNSINYLASSATEIWCWGESSKVLFKKYTDAYISIVGIPSNLSINNDKARDNSFAVVFDSSQRNEANIKLHKLTNLLSAEAFYHPDDPLYIPRSDNFDVINAQKVIGCHSSLLIKVAFSGTSVLVLPESRLLKNPNPEKSINIYDNLIEFTETDAKYHIKFGGDFCLNRAHELLNKKEI